MWRPDRARASVIRKATGAIVQRSPGRARHKPSTHCAGKAGCFGFTCMPLCSFLKHTLSHSGPRVPAGTRPSLRPRHLRGRQLPQSSGTTCRENATSREIMRDGYSSHAPDAAQRPLRRCAAEPGSMQHDTPSGSRLCTATRCVASGTRERMPQLHLRSLREASATTRKEREQIAPTPPAPPQRTRADRCRIRASPGNDRSPPPSRARGRTWSAAAIARWDRPSASAHGWP